MISSIITRVTAMALLAGGLALLFASDAILPALANGFPLGAAWIGQLLGAAWLGVAALNWSHRSKLLGGIYGRPVVYTNFVLFFVGAFSLLKALQAGPGSPGLWIVAAPTTALAIAYTALLFWGPFDPLPGDA